MAEGALRFRRDLTASKVEADGVLYVEVSDPRSGSSFRFYDFEYAVALKLDGRPLEQVATDLRESAELELTVEQLSAFADQLSSLGFAEPAPGFFPPLSEDETGEWSSPSIRALESPGSAGLFKDEPRSPPPVARSLSEHTFTTYPPEVRPSSWDGDKKSEAPVEAPPSTDAQLDADAVASDELEGQTSAYKPLEARPELSRTPTPTPEPDAAATDLAMPQFGFGSKTPTPTPTPEPTPAPSIFGRGKPSGTPTPEPLGSGASAPSASLFPTSPFAREEREDGASSSEATVADARPPTLEELGPPPESAPQIEDAVRGATEGLGDISSLLGEPGAEKTPVPGGGFPPAPSADLPPLVASPPPAASATSAPSSDRRELPTKRLRAVSDLSAEEPGEVLHDADKAPAPPAPFPGPLPGSLGASKPAAPAPMAGASPTAALPLASSGSASLRPSEVGRLPSWMAYAALGTLAAVVIAVVAYKYKSVDENPPVAVRTEVPSPSTVYRYWDQSGTVERAEGTAFAFASEGKVAELAATGAQFGAGDVIGLLESGKRFRADLLHNRERLAYYEQRREEMIRDNNRPEIRQSEIKIAEKRRLIDEAQAGLTKHAIVALQSGEVAEALMKPGDTVKEGQPALRVKGTTYRVTFTMSAEDAQKARQLGFCRVEIEGKPIDCSLSAEGGDETRVVIDLPNDSVVAAGKSVRLSRDRLEGVFNLPASAVERVGDSDRLYVVIGGGPGLPTRAEPRVIAVAARTDTHVVVTQGIDVGDRVIIDRPPGLKAEDRVMISE